MSIFSTNVVTPGAHWAKKGTRNKPAIKLLCYLCVCDSIFLTDIRKYMSPDVAFSEADYQWGLSEVCESHGAEDERGKVDSGIDLERVGGCRLFSDACTLMR